VEGTLQLVYNNTYFVIGTIAIQIFFIAAFRLYVIRLVDSSLELVVRGFAAIACSALVLVVLMFLTVKNIPYTLRLSSVYFSFSTLFLLGYRVLFRLASSYHMRGLYSNDYSKTIIYGAGEIGIQLARQFFKKKLNFNLIGFVDDDKSKWGSLVAGLPVFEGGLDNLLTTLRAKEAETLIIAITDLSRENMRKALDVAAKLGVDSKIVPSLFELENERKSAIDIRSVNVEDLLGRSSVAIDKTPIENVVRGKRILVTGAGGTIGNEISRQLLAYHPQQLLLLDIDETELHNLSLRLHKYQAEFSEEILPIVCDVCNKKKVASIFEKYRPQIVFHAAANKHVPMMEYYPEEAIRTNIGGTYNIFSNALKYEAQRCILISTDKAVNPTNIMGATKRVAELVSSMLSTEKTKIVCVRFGNVLGSRGSMLPLFLEQMEAGLPVTVTDRRIIRYFMSVSEAVSLVFLAGSVGESGEVMVLDMGEQVNVYEFANRLVRYFGNGKSEVVITGLRAGEKLYEEKLSDLDTSVPTEYPKVFKAIVNNSLNEREFLQFLDKICKEENGSLIEALQKIIPEFDYQGIPNVEVAK
jgi:FlaA1/EpsC-like NDP-sugar epimerase